MLLRVKDSIAIIYRQTGSTYEVNFLHKSSGLLKSFQFNESAFQCLFFLDGRYTLEMIKSQTKLDVSEILRVINCLDDEQLLIKDTSSLLTSSNSKFSSQLNFLSDFESEYASNESMQAKLLSAKVVLLGLGGIGSWVVQSLVLMGVENFILIDPDRVDASNLCRQALFDQNDIGTYKTHAALQKLNLLNPKIQINHVNEYIKDNQRLHELIRLADLVINCADEPDADITNSLVTEACFSEGLPHILCGGYDGHIGSIGPTVIPGISGCWYCYGDMWDKRHNLTGYKHLLLTDNHAQGGNLAPISAIIGNIHALEAVKVLTGFATPTYLNAVGEINFVTLEHQRIEYSMRSDCHMCGSNFKESP